MIFLALAAAAIPGFAIAKLYAPNFVMIHLLYAVIFFTYESIARAFCVAFDNPLMGMLQYLQVWFVSFLFAGVMIRVDQVIWPLRLFCYIFPLKWGIANLAYLDVADETFAGAYECDLPDPSVTDPSVGSGSDQGLNSTAEICFLTHDVDSGKGWYCDDDIPIAQCYGYHGVDVLHTLHANFDVMSGDDNLARNFGIILAIGAFFQLQYMLIAFQKANEYSKIVAKKSP